METYEHVYFSPSHLNEIENDSEFNTERLIHGDVQKFNSKYYNLDNNLYGNTNSRNALCTSLVSVNICSVPKNVAGFLSEFHGCTLDIVGMCETSLNAALEPLYALPTHQTFFISRNTKGAGTLLHFRNRLKASKLEDLSLSFSFIESVFVQVILSGKNCIVGNIFRHPSG